MAIEIGGKVFRYKTDAPLVNGGTLLEAHVETPDRGRVKVFPDEQERRGYIKLIVSTMFDDDDPSWFPIYTMRADGIMTGYHPHMKGVAEYVVEVYGLTDARRVVEGSMPFVSEGDPVLDFSYEIGGDSYLDAPESIRVKGLINAEFYGDFPRFLYGDSPQYGPSNPMFAETRSYALMNDSSLFFSEDFDFGYSSENGWDNVPHTSDRSWRYSNPPLYRFDDEGVDAIASFLFPSLGKTPEFRNGRLDFWLALMANSGLIQASGKVGRGYSLVDHDGPIDDWNIGTDSWYGEGTSIASGWSYKSGYIKVVDRKVEVEVSEK